MEIFLAVLAFIIFLIIIVLALPVHIIIKKEEEKAFYFEIRSLLFKFKGEDEEGISLDSFKRLFKKKEEEKDNKKEEKPKQKLSDRISKFSSVISQSFSELCRLFKRLKVNKLYITVVCAEENAADTAISYGKCCALIYPLVGLISSAAKVNPDNERVDIFCDYTSEKPSFSFETDISVRIFRIVSAAIKIGLKLIPKR